jgi:hypothetical protein
MRLGAIVSEAWRNIASGTTRAGIFFLALSVFGLGLALADASSMISMQRQSVAFQKAGAATYILSADGGISGEACDQLATIRGITASGALRTAQGRLNLAAMPGAPVPLLEVTSHFFALLALDKSKGGSPPVVGTGLLLSKSVGDVTGGEAGSTLALDGGEKAKVAEVFEYPNDGRLQALSYAALEPVTASGTFDQCWAQVWPPNEMAKNLISSALLPQSSTANIAIGQLNSTLGESFDGPQRFASRATEWAPLVAAMAGVALGYLAIRLRRLEIASSRHAGVRFPDVIAQVGIETSFWAAATSIVGLSILWMFTRWAGTVGIDQIVLISSRSILGASTAAVVGGILAAASTRERHLFRYFKERL